MQYFDTPHLKAGELTPDPYCRRSDGASQQ
jgi:hypothetical protein